MASQNLAEQNAQWIERKERERRWREVMRQINRDTWGMALWCFVAAGVIAAVFLLAGIVEVKAQTQPRSAMVTDSNGRIWVITEGPRAIGSPLSSFHVQRPIQLPGQRVQPLPPIVNPNAVQSLGGGYYQPNPGYVPWVNPYTGQFDR